jgi:hypothetical protein
MLNLQTITEDLGTACHGKAWVIVTSQQDIDSIMKDMGTRSNDFSKIQGRFDTRLSLTSGNVGEVIKRRILAKNETAAQTLRLLFEQKETIIKNLIVFNDGVEKKLYSDEKDFTEVYPFVPYQFMLLASVLTAVRKHGASGKHLSEGERSMLALFKESAVRLMVNDAGAIVPFNMFYDALHKFLDHSHANVIDNAIENEIINPDHEDDCFAVEVLKALFMVKYVEEIEANADNLVSLLADSLDTDRIALKKKVDDALAVLTGQKLVQKNGEIYVFLTDEEQDINREIDRQSVELAEVTAKIADLIFEDIFSEKRYRHSLHNGRYTFAFNQTVDGHLHRSNQGHDIGLHILTPNSDIQDETSLRMRSGQGKEVLVVLPSNRDFFDEMREAMKIDKYLTTASSGILVKYEQIKAAKGDEARRRKADAKLFLQEALKTADIYVNGDKAQIPSKDVTARLNEALSRLVDTVYHKLSYIESPFNESDIRSLLKKSNQSSLSIVGEQKSNPHALADVLDFIALNSMAHTKTSMKTLLDRFMKAPYGFIEADVEWLVAKLFCDGDIAFSVNGAPITQTSKSVDEIVDYVTKKQFAEKLMTEQRERANEEQKKTARDTMKELFGTAGASDDDDAIMQAFQEYCKDRLRTIKEYEIIGQGKPYPGNKVLEEGKALLRKLSQIEYPFEFYRAIEAEKENCLNFADGFSLVRSFYEGEQKKIFDDALAKMVIYDDSKTFIVDAAVEQCVAKIKDILAQREPYSDIPKLPALIKDFVDAYSKLLNATLEPIYEALNEARQRVLTELDQKPYKDEVSATCHRLFAELKDKAEKCNNIATLQNIKVEADALKMRLLNDISKRDAERQVAESTEYRAEIPEGSNAAATAPKPQSPKVKNVSIKNINVGGTWQIKSEADIDERIAELRKRIRNEMEENTVLNIEF